jgi:hypothetical protein
MTLEAFRLLQGLEDRRVRMTFSDGQVVVATLVSVTVDLDESRHIVYEKVESSAFPHPYSEKSDHAWYASGESLLACAECP